MAGNGDVIVGISTADSDIISCADRDDIDNYGAVNADWFFNACSLCFTAGIQLFYGTDNFSDAAAVLVTCAAWAGVCCAMYSWKQKISYI